MKYYNLLALLVVLPPFVNAKSIEVTSPYYIKGGVNSSILDDSKKESEAFGFEAVAGYHFKNDIFFEAGYQNFNVNRDDNHDLEALTIRANWLMPVSDFTAIYAGPGFSYIDNELSPSAQLGLQYQLSRNWIADVSYQGIFDINKLDDDLYSFSLSFLYRFSTSQPDVKDDMDIVFSTPELEEPEATPIETEACHLESMPYRLVEGDYLIKISETNHITLKDILDLNPQLRGRNINLVYPGEIIYYPVVVCK
ncbi:outer membrane beta-barrel protein [Vibrio jasicida]|uniref:outer membrane beta-barrel protein n=1 Tax=Vibrio jasicida TaxID=766224 RepID=UPI0003A25742|nr:outer membrane beta-barrel protein [Vibrio jasicida]